jgi:two-component system heavy metal sensor histidine kinase CusS
VSVLPRDLLNLQLAVDLTQEQVILERQRVWVWVVFVAALLLCPAVGAAIARRGTQPLRDVAETARHVGSKTLNERIHSDGYPAEVRVLANAFNAMLERLEESFGRLSRFSADIAHELRTPVNNIRGEAEVALARARTPEEYVDALGSCLEESVRLSELIEPLLFLARSESPGDQLKLTREDLGQILEDLREYYEATAAEIGVTLTVSAGDGVAATVDRTLFQRAIGNLISNALAHCSPGDNVRLSARVEAGRILVDVSDTGSGISADALPRVFDRFYRADPARTRNPGSAGLGLAIVQQIITLHGGEVRIVSELGRGTSVTLVLPQALLSGRHSSLALQEGTPQ